MGNFMNSEMVIALDWLPPFQGPEEIQRTSATLEIRFGSENATRFEDAWSQSVQHGARVSAYPLALWLASSWWRIRWEPLPSRIRLVSGGIPADTDWRMSHQVPAAGYGFIWPPLTFASDGEAILVSCRPSAAVSSEPVRYLSEFEAFVPGWAFEREVDRFMDLVLRRLDSLGQTELHVLWNEVLAERADATQAAARRFEARVGFDPDEAPVTLIQRLLEVATEGGPDAADEIAPVCSGSHPAQTLNEVVDLASQPGVAARVAFQTDLPQDNGSAAPEHRGRRLANSLRDSLRLGMQSLDDQTLADLLQIHCDHLNGLVNGHANGSKSPSMGLAVRTGENRGLKLLFRKRNRPARRFEAARFIADYLCAPHDRWLPVTDAATARQKFQRAFAAEFLCPIESLSAYLGSEFFPEAFEDAADHFGISELAVKSHLANHHLIPRTLVESQTIA
jgi:hypothetical protein